MAKRRVPYKGKFGGLVDNASPFAQPEGSSPALKNIYFPTKGAITKRPGWGSATSHAGTTGIIKGVYGTPNYVYMGAGTLLKYVARASFAVGTGPTTSSGLTLTDDNLWNWAYWPYHNVYVAANGTNIIEIIESGPTFRNLCIAAPTYAPGQAVSSGGNVNTGAHTYVFAYGIAAALTSKYSNSSPSVVATTTTDKTVTLTKHASEPAPDAQVTHVHIFRSSVGTTTPLYYVASVAIATWLASGYADTAADSTIIGNTQYAATQTAITTPEYLAVVNGRLFCSQKNSKTVEYSDENEPWYFNNDLEAYSGNVTGLSRDPGSNNLIIFTADGVEIVDTSTSPFTRRQWFPNAGCVCGHSIVDTGTYLYYHGANRVWRLRGLELTDISSESVSEYMRTAIATAGHATLHRDGTYRTDRNELWWSVAHNPDDTKSLLIYDLNTGQWTVSEMTYSAVLHFMPATATLSGYLLAGRNQGSGAGHTNYYLMHPITAPTLDIANDAEYETPWLDFGTDDIKRLFMLRLYYTPEAATTTLTITIQWLRDKAPGATVSTSTQTVDLVGNGYKEFPLQLRVQYVKLKFSQATRAKYFTINGFDFDYEVLR